MMLFSTATGKTTDSRHVEGVCGRSQYHTARLLSGDIQFHWPHEGIKSL